MFNTLDSQPEEWLLNDPDVLHTICFCCFPDSATAKKWVHALVPRNQNGRFVKWSGGGRKVRNRKWRLEFIEAVNRNYDEIDFTVHCISSTEAEISQFAQMFYLQNHENITQELDERNRNCLVFKISEKQIVKFPALRVGIIIWTYYAIKYMKEVNNLNGFIYSDWFSGNQSGVGMVNFLLQSSGIELKLSLPINPGDSEADLLSDWFAGWSNGSKIGIVDDDIREGFEGVLEREPKKIDWLMYACDLEIELDGSEEINEKIASDLGIIGYRTHRTVDGRLILVRPNITDQQYPKSEGSQSRPAS